MKLFLIIGLAMLFILGPVLMLRPSARDRRLAGLRLAAQQHKVRVQPVFLARDPVFSATRERNLHLDQFSWSRYQRIADENQTGPSIKGKWIQRKTPAGKFVWESQDIRQQTNAVIDAVLAQWEQSQQPDFLALELGPRSVSVVWNEKGDVAVVEQVCQQLEQLLTH